mmetsp:Transcript_7258/g.9472  ORF Transcript_7258/g.9472 Transcript_7258/m.9472 type:complete len:310 (-) Transcript_7258:591-1520(-)
MTNEDVHPKYSPMLRTAFAGMFANISECMIMHPLDSIKTRFQLVQPGERFGLGVTLKEMWRSGGMSEVYRGVLPAVGMQGPRGVIKFVSNSFFMSLSGLDPNSMSQQSSSFFIPSLKASLSGFLAGATESLFITPFELIKVQMQSSAHLKKYKSSLHAVGEISKTNTLFLFTGLKATMLRNGSWNGVFFGTIYVLKNLSKTYNKGLSERPEFSFLCGMTAGAFGSCFSNPFDVCKTRIQNETALGALDGRTKPSKGIMKMIFEIGRTEGISALYRGFLPKVLRLGPGGGILLASFDMGVHIFDRIHNSI